MAFRELPARANLDHLRHEAKALHRAFRDGDPTARQRIRDAGETAITRLTDAQRVIAREYGFASWARLRAHVNTMAAAAPDAGGAEARQSTTGPVGAFLAAVYEQDAGRAREVLRVHPDLPRHSVHVAATLGLTSEVERLVAADPAYVHARTGAPPADALLYLCYSPFHGESPERDAGLLATARVLLDAGADPNTRDARYGVPVLYAVTGLRSVLPIARLLLDAGANPTDGESVFHAAEHFYEEALELLLARGADLNYVGEWGNTALHFLLRYHDLEREPTVWKGLAWLLRHGADPNVPSGQERETALQVAARRGQSAEVIRQLIEHGADVHARRADGGTAWLLAARGGFDAVCRVLEEAGAEPEPLSAWDALMAAVGRGDADEARRLAPSAPRDVARPEDAVLLAEAAAAGRDAVVIAGLAAGLDVNAVDSFGATALHHAAIHGRAALARLLIDAGADLTIRDTEHSSTPLGWACFGADFVADDAGDYSAAVRVLLEAGARRRGDEYVSRHPGVRAVFEELGL